MNTEGYGQLASDLTADTAIHLAALSRLQAEHAQTLHQLEVALEQIADRDARIVVLEALIG